MKKVILMVLFFTMILLSGANVNETDNNGLSPLMYAVGGEQAESVKILLKKGANLNLKNKKKQTALDIAKEKKYHYIVELLEEAGIKQ